MIENNHTIALMLVKMTYHSKEEWNVLEYLLYIYFGISLLMAFYGLGQLAYLSVNKVSFNKGVPKNFKEFITLTIYGFIMFVFLPIAMLFIALKKPIKGH